MSMLIPSIELKGAKISVAIAKEALLKCFLVNASEEEIANHCEAYLDEFYSLQQLEKFCEEKNNEVKNFAGKKKRIIPKKEN